MKLTPVSSSVSLSHRPPMRVETPLSIPTPLRMGGRPRQPSSYAPLVQAVPSTQSHLPAMHQVTNCVASVVAAPPPAADSVSLSLPKSSASASPALVHCSSPQVEPRRIGTPDSAIFRRSSTGFLSSDGRRSSSCMAELRHSPTMSPTPTQPSDSCLDALTRVASPVMRRTMSPLRPRTLSSPMMHSRSTLSGSLSGSLSGILSVPSSNQLSALGTGTISCTSTFPSTQGGGAGSTKVPQGRAASTSAPTSRQPSQDRPSSTFEQRDSSTGLSVENLQYDTFEFDPSAATCKLKITAQLGLTPNARIESLMGHAGGLNQGMWAVSDSSQALILKLIKCQRHHPMIPTETESFQKLAREYPSLLHDRGLAFPLKIFRCRGPAGNTTHDLIVMRRAGGEAFTDVINRKCHGNRLHELMQDFDAAGSFLAGMHSKYGLQHGDFQPSNLFYDEATKQFTMIDIADLAPSSYMVVQEGDVEHFCKGVRLLARFLGDQLQVDGLRHFKAGYTRGMGNGART